MSGFYLALAVAFAVLDIAFFVTGNRTEHLLQTVLLLMVLSKLYEKKRGES